MKQLSPADQKTNVIVGITFIVFSIILLIELMGLKSSAKILPAMLAYGIAGIGSLLILQAFIDRRKYKKQQDLSDRSTDNVNKIESTEKLPIMDYVWSFIAMVVTFILIPFIGFYTTVMFFMFFIFNFYSKKWNLQEIRNSVLFCVLSIIALYIIFHILVKLHTPSGILL